MAKIVIIDDEYDNLTNLRLVLSAAKHEVFQFANSLEALDTIKHILPDIIFCPGQFFRLKFALGSQDLFAQLFRLD